MDDNVLLPVQNDLKELCVDNEEIKIESIEECFPRSEYCFRFEGSSIFQMSNPNFWGTYFRSTAFGGNADRLSHSSQPKYFKNEFLNIANAPIAKSGSLLSPWGKASYNIILSKIISKFAGNIYPLKRKSNYIGYGGLYLYDLLLDYKNQIAENISSSFSNTEILEVYHCNDYPCVMVTIPRLMRKSRDSKPKKSEIIGETGSFYSIVCAYYVAICNNQAQSLGIPIEMVLRSSFGHNGPSVTETSSSFRINVGIVPFEYCKVISSSLFQLQELFLKPLFELKLKLSMKLEEIARHNDQVDNYNKQRNDKGEKYDVEKWCLDEPLLHVLCKVGNVSRHKVSYELSRLNKNMDLLTHLVADELSLNNGTNVTNFDFASPLSKLLSYLMYEETKSSKAMAKMKVPTDMYQRKLLSFDKYNEKLEKEDKFWNVLSVVFTSLLSSDELSKPVEDKKLNGLYCKLETANIEFLGKSSHYYIMDDCESDSDCEVETESTSKNPSLKLYCRKITVATGTKAISIAVFIALYLIREKKAEHDVTYMYYETSTIIKFTTKIEKVLVKKDLNGSACIKYIDLNHCAASGPHKVNLKDISVKPCDIIVLDYTSSQTKQINQAIKYFINQVLAIILVSSGLKNEQVGADINPYGTVRIVTKDLGLLNELYFLGKVTLASEELPKNFNLIRKSYKAIGAAVTFKRIFSRDTCHYTFRSYQNQNDFSLITTGDSFEKIINLFNDYNLRENVCNPLLDFKLERILSTFIRNNFDKEIARIVPDLCFLANEYSISSDINSLETDDFLKLVRLYNSHPTRIKRLLGKYNQDLSFLNWRDDKFKFLSCSHVENLWDDLDPEDKIYFNDLEELYDENSEIVESIVYYYKSLADQGANANAIFFKDDFNAIFQRLADKADNYQFWCYDPDFSFESELSLIYNENMEDYYYEY